MPNGQNRINHCFLLVHMEVCRLCRRRKLFNIRSGNHSEDLVYLTDSKSVLGALVCHGGGGGGVYTTNQTVHDAGKQKSCPTVDISTLWN